MYLNDICLVCLQPITCCEAYVDGEISVLHWSVTEGWIRSKQLDGSGCNLSEWCGWNPYEQHILCRWYILCLWFIDLLLIWFDWFIDLLVYWFFSYFFLLDFSITLSSLTRYYKDSSLTETVADLLDKEYFPNSPIMAENTHPGNDCTHLYLWYSLSNLTSILMSGIMVFFRSGFESTAKLKEGSLLKRMTSSL